MIFPNLSPDNPFYDFHLVKLKPLNLILVAKSTFGHFKALLGAQNPFGQGGLNRGLNLGLNRSVQNGFGRPIVP